MVFPGVWADPKCVPGSSSVPLIGVPTKLGRESEGDHIRTLDHNSKPARVFGLDGSKDHAGSLCDAMRGCNHRIADRRIRQ